MVYPQHSQAMRAFRIALYQDRNIAPAQSICGVQIRQSRTRFLREEVSEISNRPTIFLACLFVRSFYAVEHSEHLQCKTHMIMVRMMSSQKHWNCSIRCEIRIFRFACRDLCQKCILWHPISNLGNVLNERPGSGWLCRRRRTRYSTAMPC